MFYCRFFKVNRDTNWAVLKNQSHLHELNVKKMLPYKILTSIVLPQDEFDVLCENIHLPHLAYKKFAIRSVADLNGIWNCIVLRGKNKNGELIIYTAGQMYPLYAGIGE